MRFPRTPEEMVARGYQYDNDNVCRGCGADIEWWITPNGKKLPVNVGTAEPHWSTCPDADRFRKEK